MVNNALAKYAQSAQPMMNVLGQNVQGWQPGWRQSTNVLDYTGYSDLQKILNAWGDGLMLKVTRPFELRDGLWPLSVEQRLGEASNITQSLPHIPNVAPINPSYFGR